MSIIEPPIRTTTPLSEAGESTSELASSILATLQESPAAEALIASAAPGGGSSSVMSHGTMSQEAHDAIFGRAASTSSVASFQQRSPAIVAHEDDDMPYPGQQQLWSQPQQGNPQASQQVQQQQQHVAAAMSSGRSPRLMPVQAPPGAAPTALMIMRRRRSNSNDHSGSNSSGHKKHMHDELGLSSSGRSGSASGSGSGISSSQGKLGKKKSPKVASRNNSPKNTAAAVSGGPLSNNPTDQQQLNYSALLQQQQQQAYGMAQHPSQHMHTALRYNSSLHSTLGGYSMGMPTQLTPPSVTMELIARDRARWEADYYGSYGAGSGMDYGYDYGMDTVGGYYGATPSFRGMSAGMGMQQPQQFQQQASQQLQGQQQTGQQGGMINDLQMMDQFYQPRIQTSMLVNQQQQQQLQQQSQQLQQPTFEGGSPHKASRAPALSPIPSVSTLPPQEQHDMPAEIKVSPKNAQSRVFQERDYKTDRVWQEDDHTSRPERRTSKTDRVWQEDDHTSRPERRTSKTERVWQEDDHTSRPERRNTDKTSNKEEDKHQEEGSVVDKSQDLPPVPNLRSSENGEAPSQAQQSQMVQQPGQQPPVQPIQQPGQQVHISQRAPQGPRGNRLSVDNRDAMSYHAQYYQAPPPSTPVRHSDPSGNYPSHRVRQISDISSVAGSVASGQYPAGLPVVYPSPHHPHYPHGLIYPPTPGSIGSMPPQPHMVYQQQQVDPRHGPTTWLDPHLQYLPSPAMQQDHTKNEPAVEDAASRSKSSSLNLSSSSSQSNRPTTVAAPTPSPPPPSTSAPAQIQTNPEDSKPKKRVSFSHLQIRTYETILGDNPSCSGGPSLGLGWRYDPSHYTATVDDYERYQAQLYGLAEGQRYECRPEDLVLHRYEREAILLNTGYTRQDLADSVRATNKVKNKRRQTVHNLPVAFVEERVEVAKRTLKRWLGKKERTRHMYEEWKRKSSSGSS